jgi:hypothetical protein
MDAGTQLFKETDLIRRQMSCNTCGRDMTCFVRPQRKDGFMWRCQSRAVTVRSEFKYIKNGSWFQHSNLISLEVLFLTYDIVRRVPATLIEEEHHFNQTTISDWGQFWKETMLAYLQECSEEIGGPDKIVEFDDSKFDRRKYEYNRGYPVKGKWVFGGVERHSGRMFFVPVPGRTA